MLTSSTPVNTVTPNAPYAVGVTVGGGFTTAAVMRWDAHDPHTINAYPAVPSVLYFGPAHEVLVGAEADEAARSHPEFAARDFVRRVGDSVPMMIGERTARAEDLFALMVRHVVDRVAANEGEPAIAVSVAHPACWGAYRIDLVKLALDRVGLGDAAVVSDAVAGAAAVGQDEPFVEGSTIAVYDLGLDGVDLTLLRVLDDGEYSAVGETSHFDRLGGNQFEEAVLRHVMTSFPEAFAELNHDDPAVRAALGDLRDSCAMAVRVLSRDSEATVSIALPDFTGNVRIVRGEFEALVDAGIRASIGALRHTLEAEGESQPTSIVLVGGASRVPLVAELLSEQLELPIAIQKEPGTSAAAGAALVASADAEAQATWAPVEQELDHAVVATAPARGALLESVRRRAGIAVRRLVGARRARPAFVVAVGLGVAAAGLAGAWPLGSPVETAGDRMKVPAPALNRDSAEPASADLGVGGAVPENDAPVDDAAEVPTPRGAAPRTPSPSDGALAPSVASPLAVTPVPEPSPSTTAQAEPEPVPEPEPEPEPEPTPDPEPQPENTPPPPVDEPSEGTGPTP